MHVRSKLVGKKDVHTGADRVEVRHSEVELRTQAVKAGGSLPAVSHRPKITSASLSISFTPKSYELREELAKIAVLSVVSGYVNEGSVLDVIPSILSTKLAGPPVPLNEAAFLLPFENRNKVREVVKLGTFDAMTKDGKCKLN